MVAIPYTAGFHSIARGVYAYLQPPGTWGYSNCGLVVDEGRGLLVDTQFDLPLTRRLRDAIRIVEPNVAVTTVVNTHANGDHCWGNQLFADDEIDVEIVSSEPMAHALDHEIGPAVLAQLCGPAAPQTALGRYMRRHFARYDFTGIVVTPPTRTFVKETVIQIGSTVVELRDVGPAHTDGDVIAYVPKHGVVFAGDLLFIGDHPIVWTGPVRNWLQACWYIKETGAEHVVPGHGPVTDATGVQLVHDYLEHVAEQTQRRYDAGMPYWQAARDIPLPPPFDSWGHRERLVISVAAIYRELGLPDPLPVFPVLERMAEAAEHLDASM